MFDTGPALAAEVVIIELWAVWDYCGVCGGEVLEECGVPMWEGMVLPDDWPGEWGGFTACRPCFVWQQTLTAPAEPNDRHAAHAAVERS